MDAEARLAQLEQDLADVEQAMRSMEEIHQMSGGRGGQAAADQLGSVVSAERFPTEFSLRSATNRVDESPSAMPLHPEEE